LSKSENKPEDSPREQVTVVESAILSEDITPSVEDVPLQDTTSEEDVDMSGTMVLSTPSPNPENHPSALSPSDLGDWSTARVWDISDSPYYTCEELSKSPQLSPTFNMESWASSFTMSPQLTLGDLAMPGWEQLLPFNEFDDMIELNDTMGAIDEVEPTTPTDDEQAPSQTLIRKHPVAAFPLGYPVTDFTAAVELINRANAVLAPFGKFAEDAQLLLQELRNLRLQLKLLRKPPPFLARSTQYYTTLRDIALDIQNPLQKFIEKLQPTCDLHYLERLSLNLTPAAFAIRKVRWNGLFVREAKGLRRMISTRTATISLLMTLTSM
jgi:hypothetical protein